MIIWNNNTTQRARRGFTLVELMVVIGVLSLLAALTLPNVRDIIREQKTARTAGMVQAYINGARAKAIGEGKHYGVVIERVSADSPIGRSHSVRLSYAYQPPPYAGDLPGAKATVMAGGTIEINRDKAAIAVTAAQQNAEGSNDPIFGPGDFIGIGIQPKYFSIAGIGLSGGGHPVVTLQGTGPLEIVSQFPAGTTVPFRLVRKPSAGLTAPLDLPDGTAIDLVYSGIGLTGDQFSPLAIAQDEDSTSGYGNVGYNPMATSPFSGSMQDFGAVSVMFDPTGAVTLVYRATSNPAGSPRSVQGLPATSNIYFLLGKNDGVFPEAPFFLGDRDRANIADFESAWVVINRQSGEVSVSPISGFVIDANGVVRNQAGVAVTNDQNTDSLQTRLQAAIGLSRAAAATYTAVE